MAIADHERIEAAVECRRLAQERGSRVEVVVAEEVTTRSGHLLGRLPAGPAQARPARSRRPWPRSTSRAGLAIVPHPFSAFTLGMRKHAILRVHQSRDPLVYWDALEGFNPSTAGRYGRAATARIAARAGSAAGRQQRRPHAGHDRRRPHPVSRGHGRGLPGGRAGRHDRRYLHHLGSRQGALHLHAPGAQADPRRLALGTPQPAGRRRPARPRRPARGAAPTARAGARLLVRAPEVVPARSAARRGLGRRRGPGIALASPGPLPGRRPGATIWKSLRREDRPGDALRLPAPGRRERARPLPLREPPAARPRRPHHHQQPRPAARLRGRRDPHRQGLQRAEQRLGGDDHASRRATCRRSSECCRRSSSTCSTSTSRSCRSCRWSSCASPPA